MVEQPPDWVPPGTKPLCFTPEVMERAKAAGIDPSAPSDYPGARPEDLAPTFDDELAIKPGETPSHEIIIRFREIARLYSSGVKASTIAQRLGYTAARVNEILALPEVKAEIKKFRTAFFDKDVKGALREAGPDFVKSLHSAILDPALKPDKRAELAKWGIEQLEGKARQQVDVNDTSLDKFMQLLKQMSANGETIAPPSLSGGGMIDVTPRQIPAGAEGPLHTTAEAKKPDAPPTRNPAIWAWVSQNSEK